MCHFHALSRNRFEMSCAWIIWLLFGTKMNMADYFDSFKLVDAAFRFEQIFYQCQLLLQSVVIQKTKTVNKIIVNFKGFLLLLLVLLLNLLFYFNDNKKIYCFISIRCIVLVQWFLEENGRDKFLLRRNYPFYL